MRKPARGLHPSRCASRLIRSAHAVARAVALLFLCAPFLTSLAGSSGPVATTTSLSITAGGNPVSSVPAGTVVTLTATVQFLGTNPASNGTVLFCDQSLETCENQALIGTAQLTSTGTASIRFVPAIGSHNYYAIYQGTSAFLASNSLPAQSLTVTGTFPTTTTLAHSGSAGNYTLTATVVGTGSAAVAPTGSVSFVDTTNSNFVVASASLGSATFAQTFAAQVAYTTGTAPSAIAVGDFNRDGIPDLAVVNETAKTVTIFLGNPDGTVTAQVPTYSIGNSAVAIAVADVNNDGFQDLIVVHNGDETVSVLTGKGDGTFNARATYDTGQNPVALAVGDFNHDGFLDLAVVDQEDSAVGILLNNGAGAYSVAEVQYAVGVNPDAVAVGDFDGNGTVDLAVANKTGGTVSVLLGVGDGTFAAQVATAAGTQPVAIAVADFNGDGHPDLVVANGNASAINVLLNSGTGTFPTAVPYAAGSSPKSVAVADFDGDGIEDLAVVNGGTNTVSVLLGNANGTFQARQVYATGTAPVAVVTADFDGDGNSDLAVVNSTANTASILLDLLTQTATGAANSVSIPGSGSAHDVKASYPGDDNFSASSSATTSLTSTVVTTGLTLSALPTSSTYGSSVTLTATLSPSSEGGLTTDGETITFKNGATTLGTGTLSGGVATLSLTTLPAGTDSLTAAYAGDTNFAAKTSTALNYVVAKATLTATANDASRAFGASNPTFTATIAGFLNGDTQASAVTGSPSITTTATTSSPVGTYPITPAAGTLASTNYTFVFVNGTLTVTQATPTITWANPAAITYGTALGSTQLDATASTPGTFAYNPVAGTVLDAGTQTLSVTFTPTDATDFSTAMKSVTITVNKATPTITWATPAAVPSGTALSATQLDATASVPGTFVYTPPAGTMPADGLDTLSVTFTPTDTANYNTATASVVLTVGNLFNLAVMGTGSDEIGNHGVAFYRFEITPGAPLNTLAANVTFSLAGLPQGATFVFSPASIAAGKSATVVKLAVRPPRPTNASVRVPAVHSALTALGMLTAPMLGLLFLAKAPRRIPHRLAVVLLALVGLGAAIGLTACAGTVGPPVQTTYDLVLTATSGNLQHSSDLTLIVNQ